MYVTLVKEEKRMNKLMVENLSLNFVDSTAVNFIVI